MANFLTLTEDETVYCLAAISRISGGKTGQYDEIFEKLAMKLADPLTIGELHRAQELYVNLTFSHPKGDTSVSFVECFRRQ